jgi:hypothetical protein
MPPHDSEAMTQMPQSFRIFQVRTDTKAHDRICEIAEATGKSRNAVTLALLRRGLAELDRTANDELAKAMAGKK